MVKLNCWEYMQCGREPNGSRPELATCPAAEDDSHHRTNRGKHAGRYCWRVVGTFCNGETQGTHAQKLETCLDCDFFKLVMKEEGDKFII